jgi:hypothetical protein
MQRKKENSHVLTLTYTDLKKIFFDLITIKKWDLRKVIRACRYKSVANKNIFLNFDLSFCFLNFNI